MSESEWIDYPSHRLINGVYESRPAQYATVDQAVRAMERIKKRYPFYTLGLYSIDTHSLRYQRPWRIKYRRVPAGTVATVEYSEPSASRK
jgi:hypothetical protein